VNKLLTTVPVCNPPKEAFFRAHPGEDFRLHTALLELKEEREVCLIAREILGGLAGESTVSPRLLVTCITHQNNPFLWPLRLPRPDGRFDDWGRSALEATEVAKGRWARVAANLSAGCYEVLVAPEALPPPEWPEMEFGDLLRVAFKEKLISSTDHTVLRKLRGEL
jgi:hypothetical protein